MADAFDTTFQRLGITDPSQQAFIRALNQVEAGGRVTDKNGGVIYGQPIVSGTHKGDKAMGPLQVMPKTFQGVLRESGLKLNPSDNQDLITAGAWLAMDNLKRAGGDYTKAAAAHLGGPAAMNRVIKDATSGDNTAAYAKRVVGLMGEQPTTQTAKAPAQPAQPAFDLAALTELAGGNPVAAAMAAQQAGLIPTDTAVAGNVQTALTTPSAEAETPAWLNQLQTMTNSGTGDNGIGWIPGAAEQAIAALPKVQIDTEQLQNEVDLAQSQRLAQAFGEPAARDVKLPGAVDRYVQNLLET